MTKNKDAVKIAQFSITNQIMNVNEPRMIVGTIGVGITMIILVLLWMGMSLPSFYG